MRKYKLCGLGNSLVDILVKISDKEFEELGFEKGTMNLVEDSLQSKLVEKFQNHQPVLASGGSVANSVVTFAELGGKAAFTSCVGDDKYGLFYINDFKDFGIEFTNSPIVNAVTGTCVSLITPDTERTLRTCLAVSGILSDEHVNQEIIKNSEWLFIEGYLFANKEKGLRAVKKAIEYARAANTKIAITFSDTWLIDVCRMELEDAVGACDLIFANESEAMAYTRREDRKSAFDVLAGLASIVAMTAGGDGAYLSYNGEKHHVKAYPATPVDMTGAGDAFAGAFLYGINHNVSPVHAVHAGCFLAGKVISQVGARLHTGIRPYWDECIKKL